MPRQIQGSQRDFSYGEVDIDLKRNDDHPARKAGLRQMLNARIHNSNAVSNRPGRSVLYPTTGNTARTERLTMAPGAVFDILFGPGTLKVVDATGAMVGSFTQQGNGSSLPWLTSADIASISHALYNKTITICFGHSMRPQVLTWDGVSTWTLADYTEALYGTQKRTAFYRLSPQGIGLKPNASVGSGITLFADAPLFVSGMIGTRMRFIGRQMLITGVTNSTTATITIEESMPGSQDILFSIDPATAFSLGDEVIGSVTGSKGIVTAINSGTKTISVQLLTSATILIDTNPNTFSHLGGGAAPFVAGAASTPLIFAFTTADTIAGPAGALAVATLNPVLSPQHFVDFWDDEVMNDFRGYPASVFADQFRLGFCDFPAVPGGIAWSEINDPIDLYVGPISSDAMFEIAPGKTQIYYVVPGPEGSEFIFADRGIFYIPISETSPLRPGSVAFKRLSGDGAAKVQPRVAQQAILYANAGQNSMMAIIATGAYQRPYDIKSLTDYHSHLFTSILAIAAPSADGTFNERYAYVLNSDGSIVVGKYKAETLPGNEPVIGWGPWNGAGTVSWIAASGSDVLFTSVYFGAGLVEKLDDNQYLDSAVSVNALPAALTPPIGKGPLWFLIGQLVTLMDQGTRTLGAYRVDGNGFIIPQGRGGEDLTAASLVAGQPWINTTEPFAPDAPPGVDQHQRMMPRSISNIAIYVIHATGFSFAKLFSSKQTATSPPLGTIMNTRIVPAYNMGDDATKPPPQRETTEGWRPSGTSYDPRIAIIKDTPGPFFISEIAMEVTL